MNALTHQLADCLRFVGMRDRLRCPFCAAVGTWKPHGGWFDREDKRKVRRWLCKWCGFYEGPEGMTLCHLGDGQWEIAPSPLPNDRDTPKYRCRGANPWYG